MRRMECFEQSIFEKMIKKLLIQMRYPLIVVTAIFMLFACAGSKEQMKSISEIKVDSNTDLSLAPKTKDVTELKQPLDRDTLSKIIELRCRLVMNGVPEEWFDKQLHHETFKIHPTIGHYFKKSAEKKVDHETKHSISWYFGRMGVDAKIEKGKRFVAEHSDIFENAEARHGIHRELIAAIIGFETNFADQHQRGDFYAFNSLVSQYIFTNRKGFAIREIIALYNFTQKTGYQPQYFTSSYAGAIGWGQFIPSSLVAFFIDANGVHEDMDPFSLEDTLFSVENYLYEHNLSGKNIDDYNAKYKAVLAYNHSDVYVKAVLYVYEGLRNYFCPSEPELSIKTFQETSEIQSREFDSRTDVEVAQCLQKIN